MTLSRRDASIATRSIEKISTACRLIDGGESRETAMKAAVFYDPFKMDVRDDIVEPSLGPGEVMVEVKACGICGSDLHLYRTNAHRGAGVLRINEQGLEIPGHEYSGVILQVGEGVSGYQVGDKVVGVTGGGAFAERVPVPANPYQLTHMPEGVSFEEAATTEPMADALQMVRLADVQPGDNVVVFGVGIIGLGVIQALRALDKPVNKVVAIDVSPSRLAMALDVGATDAINAGNTEDVVAAVAALCGTTPNIFGGPDAPRVDTVIDCAGYLKHMSGPPPLQSAINMLKPRGGKIICFGAYEGPVTLDLTYLIEKQIHIIGSLGYDASELNQGLDLMASGKVDRKKLITHGFPVDQIVEAFETQGRGQAIKVMIHPTKAT
jgi:threonine dehydrogenase-like Zn-dependent dehydrogenase